MGKKHKLVLNPLMRSGLIEVRHIPMKYTLKLFLVKEQQVVETCLSYAPHEALTDCIGSRSAIGCFENLDGTRCSHTSETRPKLAIVITNEVLGCLPIGSGFPKLLRHPSIGRGSGDADMNHSACPEFDDEEGKKGSKEEIGHRKARHKPRRLGHGCAGMSSTSAPVAEIREPSAGTSGPAGSRVTQLDDGLLTMSFLSFGRPVRA